MVEIMEPTRTPTPSLSKEAPQVGPESTFEIMKVTRKIVALPISKPDIQSHDESSTADGPSSQVDNERSRSQSERDAETVLILKSSYAPAKTSNRRKKQFTLAPKKKRCGQESDQTVPSLQTLFPRNPQFLNLPKRIPLVSQVRPQPVFRRPSYTSPQLPSTSIQQSMAQLSTIGMCPPLLPISLSTLDIA